MSFISGFTEIDGKVGQIFGSQGKALGIGVGPLVLASRYNKKRLRSPPFRNRSSSSEDNKCFIDDGMSTPESLSSLEFLLNESDSDGSDSDGSDSNDGKVGEIFGSQGKALGIGVGPLVLPSRYNKKRLQSPPVRNRSSSRKDPKCFTKNGMSTPKSQSSLVFLSNGSDSNGQVYNKNGNGGEKEDDCSKSEKEDDCSKSEKEDDCSKSEKEDDRDESEEEDDCSNSEEDQSTTEEESDESELSHTEQYFPSTRTILTKNHTIVEGYESGTRHPLAKATLTGNLNKRNIVQDTDNSPIIEYSLRQNGRPEYLRAEIRPEHIDTGENTGDNSALARRIQGYGDGGDHAGHIVGNQFGGLMREHNLFPQNPSINTGNWRAEYERLMRMWLENGSSRANIQFQMRLIYQDDLDTRPEEFYYLIILRVGDRIATYDEVREATDQGESILFGEAIPNPPSNERLTRVDEEDFKITIRKTKKIDNEDVKRRKK